MNRFTFSQCREAFESDIPNSASMWRHKVTGLFEPKVATGAIAICTPVATSLTLFMTRALAVIREQRVYTHRLPLLA